MAVITVNQQVFEILKKAYKEKFGESPKLLITEINRVYQDIHDKTDKSTSADVISDKTVRNFFKSLEPGKMQEKNLNFLCRVLLGYESYQEALRQQKISEPTEITHADANGEWRKYYHEYLNIKCGTMKVLNMNKPVHLDNIYANVNVLENIKEKEQKKQNNIEELLSSLSDIDISLNKIKDKRFSKNITAIEAVRSYKKLLIWGRPGSGKTTFLKHLALHYSQVLGEQITPIFISLRAFVHEFNLIDAIKREFISYVPEPNQLVYNLLEQGQCLILLDGLDEVVETERERLYENINNCIERFPENHIVMTCRSGDSDYKFAYFTEVEMADFDDKQVLTFVKKWFASCNESKELEERFITELKHNDSIKDLSTNPLLLTMLCLVFEDNNEFPKTQYSLTEDSINILLRKWDASRRIERNKIHNFELTYHRKVNLLSKIAYDGFNQERQKFFWRQHELEELINDYIENILEINPETSGLDSLSVLKLIEANHGLLVKQSKDIYSFFHLTFQEYFVANYIVESRDSKTLENVVQQYLTQPQWREIFLIIAGRLSHADQFFKVIFNEINKLVASKELQELLNWLDEVTSFHEVKSSAWRAFYLFVNYEFPLFGNLCKQTNNSFIEQLAVALKELNSQRGQIKERSQLSSFAFYLVETFCRINAKANEDMLEIQNINPLLREHILISEDKFVTSQLQSRVNIDQEKGIITINKQEDKITLDKDHLSNDYINTIAKDSKWFEDLSDELKFLKDSFPADNAPVSDWKQWAERLQGVVQLYLHIAYDDVKFSPEQIKILEDYIYANILLIECIKVGSYSSKDLRNQIIDHLLLPKGRIPQHLKLESHIS